MKVQKRGKNEKKKFAIAVFTPEKKRSIGDKSQTVLD